MRRILIALISTLTLIGGAVLLTPSASADFGPVPAIGVPVGDPANGMYPEKRQFVENQAWWMPASDQVNDKDSNHGHAHMGVAIPEREQLVGSTVKFTVRLVMHDNPGTFNYVSMIFKSPSTEVTVQKCYAVTAAADGTCPGPTATGKGDWKCDKDPATPGAQGDCVKWLTFQQPLSAFNNSGLQEVRFRGFIPEPKRADGTSVEMRTNINFQTYVNNGKSAGNVTREPQLRGKGWYTNSIYCESQVNSVPIPDAPVSGNFPITLEQTTHSSDASLPVTHSFVTLDPDFHAIPEIRGTVLHDAAAPMSAKTFNINTTTLTNGIHRLHQRADCRDNTLRSVNSGVLVVPFVVQNANPTVTPTPTSTPTPTVTPTPTPTPTPTSTGPAVTLTAPTGGAVLRGTYRFNATSPNATSVAYLVDGVEVARDSSCCAWDEDVSTLGLSEGTHTVKAVATNASGTTVTPEVTVTVDNIA